MGLVQAMVRGKQAPAGIQAIYYIGGAGIVVIVLVELLDLFPGGVGGLPVGRILLIWSVMLFVVMIVALFLTRWSRGAALDKLAASKGWMRLASPYWLASTWAGPPFMSTGSVHEAVSGSRNDRWFAAFTYSYDISYDEDDKRTQRYGVFVARLRVKLPFLALQPTLLALQPTQRFSGPPDIGSREFGDCNSPGFRVASGVETVDEDFARAVLTPSMINWLKRHG